jgi:hypothetical protein
VCAPYALSLLPVSRFLLASFISTLKIEATCSSETSVTFNELHSVISQKMELFITTAVRTSDPAGFYGP